MYKNPKMTRKQQWKSEETRIYQQNLSTFHQNW